MKLKDREVYLKCKISQLRQKLADKRPSTPIKSTYQKERSELKKSSFFEIKTKSSATIKRNMGLISPCYQNTNNREIKPVRVKTLSINQSKPLNRKPFINKTVMSKKLEEKLSSLKKRLDNK